MTSCVGGKAFTLHEMHIHLVIVAWLYVVLMMAVAEAQSSQGSVLGAILTFVLYGVLPLSVLVYILATPARRRARRARELAERSVDEGDGRGHAAERAVAAEREEG
jgi:membrane protein implicated in regulation of membrane protease activity